MSGIFWSLSSRNRQKKMSRERNSKKTTGVVILSDDKSQPEGKQGDVVVSSNEDHGVKRTLDFGQSDLDTPLSALKKKKKDTNKKKSNLIILTDSTKLKQRKNKVKRSRLKGKIEVESSTEEGMAWTGGITKNQSYDTSSGKTSDNGGLAAWSVALCYIRMFMKSKQSMSIFFFYRFQL